MKPNSSILPIIAMALLAACSSGDPAPRAEATDAQQAEMVEDAVRQSYEARGAEVVDIAMARSGNGSRFSGYATVRDAASGNELEVHCSYSQGPGGEPSLDCSRTDGGAAQPVVAPSEQGR